MLTLNQSTPPDANQTPKPRPKPLGGRGVQPEALLFYMHTPESLPSDTPLTRCSPLRPFRHLRPTWNTQYLPTKPVRVKSGFQLQLRHGVIGPCSSSRKCQPAIQCLSSHGDRHHCLGCCLVDRSCLPCRLTPDALQYNAALDRFFNC